MDLDQRAAQLADWIMTEDMTKMPPNVVLASVKLFLMAQRDEALRETPNAASHLKISHAARAYHDIGETEPFPRIAWIDAWNNLKTAIAELRAAERDTR